MKADFSFAGLNLNKILQKNRWTNAHFYRMDEGLK